MTTRKRILLVVLLLLIVTVLRESGYLNFNFYRSEINGHTNSQWNNNFTRVNIPWKISNSWNETIKSKCNFDGEIGKCPIEVIYKSTNYGDSSDCKNITVNVYDISPGAIWTPLYKSANFKASASCRDGITLLDTRNDNLMQTSYDFSGNTEVSGHIIIYGFSSYKNAKDLIVNFVVQQVYQDAKNKVHTQ